MRPILPHPLPERRWLKCCFSFLLASFLLVMLWSIIHPHSTAMSASPDAFDCNQVTEIPQGECQALVAFYTSTGGQNWVTQAHWLETNTPCSTWLGVTCSNGAIRHVIGLNLYGGPYGYGLNGTLPPELGNLTELITLYLPGEPYTPTLKLRGSLPDLRSLQKLQTLYLAWNDISGTLPALLEKLPKVQQLVLDFNPNVTGDLKLSLPLLSPNLTQLSLNGTNISGSIPPELGSFTNLTWLYLGSCSLGGSIPPELGNLIHLTDLIIHICQPVTGSLDWVTKLTNLRHIYIESDLGGGSGLSGGIPSEIDKLNTLTNLTIKNGGLSGKIPSYLGNLTSLEGLDLSGNRLEGEIPSTLSNLTKLQGLSLANNALEGVVPALPSGLSNLDLSYNKLTCTEAAVWCQTQTAPPTNLQAPHTSVGVTTTTLAWSGIPYTNAGNYEIGYSTTSGGPYTMTVSTSRQLGGSKTVNNLCPATTYYFAVRSHTPPHDKQQNDLRSAFSNEVAVTTALRTVRLLSIHALALDSNLDAQYNPLVQGIAAATAESADKLAVILVDRQGPSNTQILVAECGRLTDLTNLHGLPEPSATPVKGADQEYSLLPIQWNPSLREYNMTDPKYLSTFVRWARETCGGLRGVSCNHPKTVFSYVGHGVPLAPATDLSRFITHTVNTGETSILAATKDYLPPAPTKVEATSDQLTDQTSLALISPYSLTQALHTATNNGADPITVLDIVHCFGFTIEELYELSNPQAKPVAEVMVGSPNYTYAGPAILSKVMLAINPDQSARLMAETIVQAYQAALAEADTFDGNPDINHPHIIVAVDSNQVYELKNKIDILASALMTGFVQNTAATQSGLSAAQQAATHYDTTCNPQDGKPDFRLNDDDSLVDLDDFAAQIIERFAMTPTIVGAGNAIRNQLANTVIAKNVISGSPWFAHNPVIHWDFGKAAGIGLYADFQGVISGTEHYLGWQAHWYTPNNDAGDNPHPYAFVQGEITWSKVLSRFWENEFGNRNDIRTIACATELPAVRQRQLFLPVIQK